MFGMTAAVKFSVSYMYSLELTTSQNGEFYGVMQLSFDSIVSIILGIYYYHVKYIDFSLTFIALSQIACCIIIWKFVPESPHYLFSRGMKSEFIHSI